MTFLSFFQTFFLSNFLCIIFIITTDNPERQTKPWGSPVRVLICTVHIISNSYPHYPQTLKDRESIFSHLFRGSFFTLWAIYIQVIETIPCKSDPKMALFYYMSKSYRCDWHTGSHTASSRAPMILRICSLFLV